MHLTKILCVLILALIFCIPGATAAAESYWECAASGVEKNGPRKVDMNFRLDITGKVLTGQIKFAKANNGGKFLPGGEYVYAGGDKLTRDVGPYEWIMEAKWAGTNYNYDDSTVNTKGTLVIRKFKIQNVAEMELKSKDGTIWFIFPHGCEYKQVTAEQTPADPAQGQ